MGSSPHSPPEISSEFLAFFRAHTDARGEMPFAQFMALALYHSEVGYYRKNRGRVGYATGTDFFTSSTSGAVFGELVAAACTQLLRAAGRDPAAHTFIEIGAEPGDEGVLTGVSHPFAGGRTLRVGDPISGLTGDCVVFSNELFDAQPFTSIVCRSGRWHPIGVRLSGERLVEFEFPEPLADAPPPAAEGYRFDQPRAAASLAAAIAGQPWLGLFVAIDYGKTLRDLTEETPAGTARAYHRHNQTNDLLAQPGEQDLTCHICWDWLIEALTRHGFTNAKLEFQETFFIRHAGEFVATASAADARGFSPRKMSLLQLLHPSQLGQKFQVLHALR
ncbi:MAG: SAM-dependent methyltransferase [Opitutaceae bacterium]